MKELKSFEEFSEYLDYSNYKYFSQLDESIQKEFLLTLSKIFIHDMGLHVDPALLSLIVNFLENINIHHTIENSLMYLILLFSIVFAMIKDIPKIIVNKVLKFLKIKKEIPTLEQYTDIFKKILSNKEFISILHLVDKSGKLDDSLLNQFNTILDKILTTADKAKIKALAKIK